MSISTQLQAVKEEYENAWNVSVQLDQNPEPDEIKIAELISQSPEFDRIVAHVLQAHLPEEMKTAVYPIYSRDVRNGVSPIEQQQRAGRTQKSVIQAIAKAINEDDIERCCWQGLLFTDRDENPTMLFPSPVPMTIPETPQDDKEPAADILEYSKSLSERIPDAIARTVLLGSYSQLQYGKHYLSTPGVIENLQYSAAEQSEIREEKAESELLQLYDGFSVGISAAELVKKDIPPTGWIWTNMLQDKGVGVLAGEPKAGKSYFALQLGIHAARGDKFLAWDTNKTDVLYLDIDHPSLSRTQKRIKEIAGNNVPENFIYWTPPKGEFFPTLEDTPRDALGAMKYLITHYNRTQGLNIGLVIVDIYATILPQNGAKNLDAYRQGRKELKNVVQFAADNNVFVLLIHHLNKAKDNENPYNRISGSNALYSAADAGLILSRSVKEKRTELFINGSDQEPGEYVLEFNDGIFVYKGTADEYSIEYADRLYLDSPIRQAIVYLTDIGTITGNMSDIIATYEDKTGKNLAYQPKQAADFVNKYEQQLRDLDGIKFTYMPHGRKYTFEKAEHSDRNNAEL